jgi:Mrp family chromosome partitioning ATPase
MERTSIPLQEALQFHSADRVMEQAVEARARLARENVWANLPELRLSPQTVEDNRIVTISRSDPAHAAFDMIRTRILQSMRQNGWTTVAITSPTPNCGKSLVAANLAFSLANQKDCRTVLVDLDLKQPGIDKLIGMRDAPSMETFLKGDSDLTDVFRRYDKNLAIGANKWPVKYSSELLQSLETTRVLKAMQQTLNPDVVLFDMTSMLFSDEVTAFLPNVDCAILVAAAEHSTFDEVDACERDLSERTNLLGVVLNKCRYDTGY